MTVTKSVGVCMYPDDVDTAPRRSESVNMDTLKLLAAELSDKANEALLVSKENGKGKVVFYNEM